MNDTTWLSAMFSRTILIFYLALIFVMVAVMTFLIYGGP